MSYTRHDLKNHQNFAGKFDFGYVSLYIRALLVLGNRHLGARSGRNMLKAIGLQIGLIAVVVLVAGSWVGTRGAISALIGGAAYLVPNLLFVLRLKIAASAGRTSVATFVAGELFKVAATIGILVVAQKFYDVHWLALLVGLFAALKANLFAFLLKT